MMSGDEFHIKWRLENGVMDHKNQNEKTSTWLVTGGTGIQVATLFVFCFKKIHQEPTARNHQVVFNGFHFSASMRQRTTTEVLKPIPAYFVNVFS